MPFSVGDGGAALVGEVVVVVVVVVDVDGAWLPLLPQPAVKTPIVMSAPPPAVTIARRTHTFELMTIMIRQLSQLHKCSYAFGGFTQPSTR